MKCYRPLTDQLIGEIRKTLEIPETTLGDDEIRGSRIRRAAKLTGAAAGVAAREATARALLATGDSDARRASAGAQQLKSAKSLVKVFSGMRGAAMKVGQTLSAVDLGLVPEEIRPEFQEILASLQQSAEPVSFGAIRKVVEEDLGERLNDVFADFDPEPIAAASIGQVHRATLREPEGKGAGREVAVKVQYPGIAEAIHSDLQNLRLGLKLLSVIAPGIDTGAIAQEIRERIGEELDYELEAANHKAMARVYRGHPFIFVPDVVTSLSRERVIVTEFVDAARFAEIRERPAAERDRIAEILIRFYLNGPLRHRLLNGDPHPGNSLFMPDGRVAFIDFGFFKRLSDAEIVQLHASTRATYDGDAEETVRGDRRSRCPAAGLEAGGAVPEELSGDLRLAAGRGAGHRQRLDDRRDDARLHRDAAAGRVRRAHAPGRALRVDARGDVADRPGGSAAGQRQVPRHRP